MEKDWLAGEAAEDMRREIAACSGNEVYFAGWLDQGRLSRIKVLARGNKFSVPALNQGLSPGMLVLHNHPGGDLTPSCADVAVAGRLGQDGVGFVIVNNRVDQSYIVVEPIEVREKHLVSQEEIERILGPGGTVALTMKDYESRDQQLEMSHTVARALNQGSHGIIEAGTGTGKSLAYLVPALQWAINNNRRVVVSTNTINLQEQLLYKDVPLLQRVLPSSFKAVLIKGRGNYLCLRKFNDILREGQGLVEDTDIPHLQALAGWSRSTSDGSRSDLSFSPGATLWELISSDGDTCLRLNCPSFRDCWFHRARREAVDAQLLIANHHLLFADIALRAQGGEGGIMPVYHSVILDEAHNIEDVATEWFGMQITRRGILRTLSRLYAVRSSGPRGLLPILERRLPIDHIDARGILDLVHQEVVPQITLTAESVQVLFGGVERMLADSGQREFRQRLTDVYCKNEGWQHRVHESDSLQQNLGSLAKLLGRVVSSLEQGGPNIMEGCLGQVMELEAMGRRLASAQKGLGEIFAPPSPGRVRWLSLEQGRQGPRVSFHDAPLSIREDLQENLWQKFSSVILTSATMAVDNNFSFIRSRLGLAEGAIELVLSSPFDYQRQIVLGVINDLPSPDKLDYSNAAAKAVGRSLEASQGRALVLFTSFAMLKNCARIIAPQAERLGIPLLCQGEMPRHRLLELFRGDTRSVLLATASFWEGVDVAGESLSSLIITRLPFTVPDEPILEARVEELRREGKNPFYCYQVPEAVLRFRQGFGRLIRSRRDRGVILVLDGRILSKPYGSLFLRALPHCPTIRGNLDTVLAKQRSFLEQNEPPLGGQDN